MNRTRMFAVAALSCLLTTACATAVHHETTACSAVSAPHTFAWLTEDPVLIQLGERHPAVRTEDNEQRLRSAIDRELEARGYTRVAKGDAELHVAFSVETQRRYRLEGARDSSLASLEPG